MPPNRLVDVAFETVKYLLDTNHWSSIQRRRPEVVARIQALPAEATLYMPVVAQAELLAGVELIEDERRRDRLRELYRFAVAQATEVLAVTSQVAERYAHIFADLRRKGTPIGTNDMWIAAIAQLHDLTLVTNGADFRFVDGLTVEDWVTHRTE